MNDDPLAGARGCALATALGLIVWLALGAVAAWWAVLP